MTHVNLANPSLQKEVIENLRNTRIQGCTINKDDDVVLTNSEATCFSCVSYCKQRTTEMWGPEAILFFFLGPPVVLVLTLFWGRVPLLKSTTEKQLVPLF